MTNRDSTATGWAAWVLLAAVLGIMVGAFNILIGIVALLREELIVDAGRHLLLLDVTQWGWVHLVVGVLQAVVGFALLRGPTWARVAAVTFAAVNAVTQLALAPAYPVWAVLVIALDVLLIWAVTVHGGEARDAASTAYR